MISRIILSVTRLGQSLQYSSYLIPCRFDTISAIDDEIGALPLFGIWHLPGQDHFKFLLRHAGPG
jgi:hypothetical protein